MCDDNNFPEGTNSGLRGNKKKLGGKPMNGRASWSVRLPALPFVAQVISYAYVLAGICMYRGPRTYATVL